MATVTFPEALGGNGKTYTDDASATTGLDAYGYVTRFVPCLSQTVIMAGSAAASAAGAAASAASALNAPGTNASQVSGSVAIGAGSKTINIQSGKAYAVGQTLVAASLANPANYIAGQVTAYDSGTGALTLSVPANGVGGTGTKTDLVVSMGALINNTLPTMTGNIGKFLTTTDGVAASWSASPLAVAFGGTGADNPSAALAGLGAQASHANLTAVSGLSLTADKLPYANGSGTLTLTSLTTFGRSLIDDGDAATARTTLGLVIGTHVQAQDAELSAIAGLTSTADRLPYFTGSGTAALAVFSSFGRSLVDDTDATGARSTLGAAADADVAVLQTAVGAMSGMIAAFGMPTAPTGWLECNGASLLRADYPALFAAIGTTWGSADGTHFTLPDLRGEFLRGYDHGKGTDTGRVFATAQADDLKAHTHTLPTNQTNMNSTGGTTTGGASGSGSATGSTGGGETRPRNIAILYCIRT
ncbi:microcystin-dependent protein [Caulobacter ginsengisoli]|uniref:Microcystin-dependent protein n=1 Tax=Caulobacter ginsengisoli TaxID=400775 RepID=A0ABU0IKV1_9CAUL|nr:phage tail protein [Caulobacter ginsengisoli]MDQ0462641.1 microcystin-dependent protein [Caulobacter ginsengisoli]